MYFSDTGVGQAPTTYSDTFELTVSPASPEPGASVSASLVAAQGPLNNGPVAMQLRGRRR